MQRMRSFWVIGALVVVSALLACPTTATVPSTMSYQGVLTDESGTLVPDGDYDLTFSIYASPSGGSPLWTETQNAIPVVKGGFAVTLGSVVPLPPGSSASPAFGAPYYLGTMIDGGPELVPRIALTASPYALSLRVPFAMSESSALPLIDAKNFGTGPELLARRYLGVGAGGATGPAPTLDLYPAGGGYELARMTGGTHGGSLTLYEENSPGPVPGEVALYVAPNPNGGGSLVIYGGDDQSLSQFWVNGNESGSGNPIVYVLGTVSSTVINANATGNASVSCPTNAISSPEMLDEPGVAQNHSNVSVLIPSGVTMIDLITVTLSTPAAGYIVVEAGGQHAFGGDGTSQNTASLQIDETAGGGTDANHYMWSGDLPSATGTRYRPIHVRRTYFKGSAGSYTFRLEGIATNPAGSTNYIWHPTITATFYPSSYGAVITGTTLAESGEFENAKATAASTVQPGGGGAEVDLRELELRVEREREQLETAERALLLAQQQAVPRPTPRRIDVDQKEKK